MKATKTRGTGKKTSARRKKREPKHDNDVLFYEEESELEEALSYFEADLSHFSMKASSSNHEGYGPH